MKIRLLNDGGFVAFSGIEFPVEVEAEKWLDKHAYVSQQVMQDVKGYEWIINECCEGGFYLFLDKEFEIVEEPLPVQKSEECLGVLDTAKALLDAMTPPENGIVDNTGLIATCERISIERQERKTKLIQLVQDYGVAINNGCYESVQGSIDLMEQFNEEENTLLAEIIKMIEDGV